MSGWLVRRAAVRPLVVAVPYGTRARLLAEAALAERHWPAAGSPAAANLLVVCGPPSGRLADAVETVWAAMPGPRARADLPAAPTPAQVTTLLTTPLHHPPPQSNPTPPNTAYGGGHDPGNHPGHGAGHGAGHGGAHGGHGGAHGGHGGHGGGHEHHMGSPGGLAMAERGPDRDGLTLDRLHVSLGPVLPDWPAGLVIETTMQGDVIQEAEARFDGPADGERFWDAPWLAAAAGLPVTRGEAEAHRAAAHLDSLGRLLAVAGWPAAAAEARLLRDHLVTRALHLPPTSPLPPPGHPLTGEGNPPRVGQAESGEGWSLHADHPPAGEGAAGHREGAGGAPSGEGWPLRVGHLPSGEWASGRGVGVGGVPGGEGWVVGRFARFARRVRRSWVLRWMLRGVGRADGAALGLRGPAACDGDVLVRMEAWLAAVEGALGLLGDRSPLADDVGPRGPVGEGGRLLEVLPPLLAGCELAQARLVVAGFDPDGGRP
ncbi:hypothetical protein [Nonomuraea sp. NPDC003214]